MKILLSGGGTAGHITPLRSVAHKLKKLEHDAEVIYVGDRSKRFSGIMADSADVDYCHQIFSGKLRRYNGESWLRRLIDIKTIALNMRDLVYVVLGFSQSFCLMIKIRPDIVFLKGGYVSVPVGFAAALMRIPFVTHDSDVVPGLANRLVGRWAKYHAVAMSPDIYPYLTERTIQTGVIISQAFEPINRDLRRQYRDKINIPQSAQFMLVTGGSSGAATINAVMSASAPNLLEENAGLYIFHQTGSGKPSGYTHDQTDRFRDRLRTAEFVDDLHVYSGAADVVVCRAGANTLADFGVQKKACIVIPAPHLAGGHQLKNAAYLAENNAAIIIQEDELEEDAGRLITSVNRLLRSDTLSKQLGDNLSSLSSPKAADDIARLLIETARDGSTSSDTHTST